MADKKQFFLVMQTPPPTLNKHLVSAAVLESGNGPSSWDWGNDMLHSFFIRLFIKPFYGDTACYSDMSLARWISMPPSPALSGENDGSHSDNGPDAEGGEPEPQERPL